MKGKNWLWGCEVGSFSKHESWCGKRGHEAGLYGANEETEK